MSQVRVRMYRQGGIGDCFLLSFSKADGVAHMLIDCGILKGTPDGGQGLKAAMQNVLEETHQKLDVLVVTHEHWDHVSGFLQAQEEFARLDIKEVWLAWTEDRQDEMANQLRQQKVKVQQAVAAASLKLRGMLGVDEQASDSLVALDSLGLFYTDQAADDLGASAEQKARPTAFTTTAAMDWARLSTGGRVRYLEPGKEAITIAGVANARFFVLGPPKKDTWLKKSDPSKKTPEVYQLARGSNLGFLEALGAGGASDTGRPFDASFDVAVEQAKTMAFSQEFYFEKAPWRQIELDWLGTAERLALQLDSDTNNTSLALAIELIETGQVLLFPGDAQVGNWLSWQEVEWMVKDAQGEATPIKAEDLLKRTALYKVGHHASHNATLREKGLEQMEDKSMVALIPVYETQARSQGKKGWDMPFGPLLEQLKLKTGAGVFRADLGAPEGWEESQAGKYSVTPGWVDVWVGKSD